MKKWKTATVAAAARCFLVSNFPSVTLTMISPIAMCARQDHALILKFSVKSMSWLFSVATHARPVRAAGNEAFGGVLN